MNTNPNPHPDALTWLWSLVYDMRMSFVPEDVQKSTSWLKRHGFIERNAGGWQPTHLAETLLLQYSRKLAERGMRCPPTDDERAKAHKAPMGPGAERFGPSA